MFSVFLSSFSRLDGKVGLKEASPTLLGGSINSFASFKAFENIAKSPPERWPQSLLSAVDKKPISAHLTNTGDHHLNQRYLISGSLQYATFRVV